MRCDKNNIVTHDKTQFVIVIIFVKNTAKFYFKVCRILIKNNFRQFSQSETFYLWAEGGGRLSPECA